MGDDNSRQRIIKTKSQYTKIHNLQLVEIELFALSQETEVRFKAEKGKYWDN